MIGGPGSVDNVIDALRVGVTYVGVLSQYSWRWPYWDDEITQLQSTLTAAGVLAAFRDRGRRLRLLPRGRLPGRLPRLRQLRRLGDARALHLRGADRRRLLELVGRADAEPGDQVGGHAGARRRQPRPRADRASCRATRSATPRTSTPTMAVLVNDLLFMKLTDMRYRLGGAPIAVPVTETERIPSWDEVATVQVISRKVDEYVPMVDAVIDWKQIEDLRDRLVAGGRHFFEAALATMKQHGCRRHADPAQRAARAQAARRGEVRGAVRRRASRDDELPARAPAGARDRPRPRDQPQARRADPQLSARAKDDVPIRGMKVVVASTDVHEFAKFLLTSTFEALDAQVIDCGINRDPEDIVKVVAETDPEAVVITTHNGVARSFATRLMDELRAQRLVTVGVHGRRPQRGRRRLRRPGRRPRRPAPPRCRDPTLRRRPRRRPRRAAQPGSPLNAGVVALSDFGSTFTKVTLVEEGSGRLLAQGHHPTTIDTDVMDGYRIALDAAIGAAGRVGRRGARARRVERRRRAADGRRRPRRRADRRRRATGRAQRRGEGRGRRRRRSRRRRPGPDRRGAPGGAAVLRRHGRGPAREGARQRRRRRRRRRPRARRRRLQRRHRVDGRRRLPAGPGGPSTSSPTSCRRSTGSTSSRRGRRSTTCSSITSSAASG